MLRRGGYDPSIPSWLDDESSPQCIGERQDDLKVHPGVVQPAFPGLVCQDARRQQHGLYPTADKRAAVPLVVEQDVNVVEGVLVQQGRLVFRRGLWRTRGTRPTDSPTLDSPITRPSTSISVCSCDGVATMAPLRRPQSAS